MEMLGGALGAIGSIVGAGLSAQAANTANMINWMNLQFQKQNAAKQMRFSQAARGDVYGNKQKYDEALNEWIISLTPTQKRITRAGELEQLRVLTEDAKRNRDIRRQAAERGKEAAKDYNRMLAGWRYAGPGSEISYRDELTNLLAGVSREQAGQQKTGLMRQALRTGQGGMIPQILKGVNDDLGMNMAQNMLRAKEGARQEWMQRQQAHAGMYLPAMKQLAELMDAGGDAKIAYSDTPEQLARLQSEQFGGIMNALKSEAGQVGGAYANLAKGIGSGGAGVASALKGLGSGFGSGSGGGRGRAAKGGGGSMSQGQPEYGMIDWNWIMQDPLGDISADRFAESIGEW